MKKGFSFLLSLLIAVPVFAKDEPFYPVSAIPEDMKKGMYAVIRDHETRYEIHSPKHATTYIRTVVTILNSNGNRAARETLFYDKFRTIKSFKANTYDAFGKLIQKVKLSDLPDRSYQDGSSLYSDDRFKSLDLSRGSFPYTVELEYEIEYKAILYSPGFYLYEDDEISIQQSKFVLAYANADLKPRYKLFRMPEPKSGTYNGKQSLEWSVTNFKPSRFEKLGPDFNRMIPNIAVAPTMFEYDKYAGSMDTWDNYGKWIILLNKDRNVLPEATKKHIQNLTKDAKSDTEKIKILYEYMQSRTRYVGIQLGIGGYQPFEASLVDKTGYGDCKALSNYMVSLLQEVGIKGYYTLVRAGEGSRAMDISFPSSQFNHVIVAVPMKADTIWLECTSQTNPFGYMGTFTGDRHALMITETGGKIVKTPRYNADDNRQLTTANVVVDQSGNAKATIQTTYRGLQYENHDLHGVLDDQYDDQKKWIQKNVKIAAFDVADFRMINNKDIIPSAVVKSNLNIQKLATVSGKRFFLTPNLMNRSTFALEKIENRKENLVWRSAFVDIDTIKYQLPEGIYPEFVPEATTIKGKFGEYQSSFLVDQGHLIYIRRFRMDRGEYPPESYSEFAEFFRSVNKADHTKIVFLSKT